MPIVKEIRQKAVMDRLNKKATDFSLDTLQGETYALSAMRGKVVLLDVGASWCGPLQRGDSGGENRLRAIQQGR